MTSSPALALDESGPWMLFQIDDRPVYMRANRDASCVAARCEASGAICDLGVACDLDRPDRARFTVNPHQIDWAGAAPVQRALLERALAVWRRHGTGEPGPVVTRQAGAHVYEFWADRSAARVEITRRAMHPDVVVIEEHLGTGDQLETATAEVRLHQRATIPAQMLSQMRALVREAWQRSTSAALAETDGGTR